MTTDTQTHGTAPEREAERETKPVPLPLQMKDSYLILDEYVSIFSEPRGWVPRGCGSTDVPRKLA